MLKIITKTFPIKAELGVLNHQKFVEIIPSTTKIRVTKYYFNLMTIKSISWTTSVCFRNIRGCKRYGKCLWVEFRDEPQSREDGCSLPPSSALAILILTLRDRPNTLTIHLYIVFYQYITAYREQLHHFWNFVKQRFI